MIYSLPQFEYDSFALALMRQREERDELARLRQLKTLVRKWQEADAALYGLPKGGPTAEFSNANRIRKEAGDAYRDAENDLLEWK